ncbi:hypothetical protein ABI59_09555 [Acidobacteria bacterium Mor1]|nr:hypothetical protein ABI59_09555 [Acidobacteria bacterium Mor1]
MVMPSGRTSHGRSTVAALLFLLLPGLALALPGEVQDLNFSGADSLAWTAASGAAGHHIYRGTLSGLAGGDDGQCLIGSIPGTTATVADDPAPGTGFFYLATGFDADGEGATGPDSNAAPRNPTVPCVPARRLLGLTVDGDPGDGVSDGVEPLQNPSVYDRSSKRERAGVFLHTGEVFLQATDLMIPGRGIDWAFQRTYRSQIGYDGPLGNNWDFRLDSRLVPLGTDVRYHDGTGRDEIFGRISATDFTSPAGRYDVLIENPDGSFSMRQPDGMILDYHGFDGSNLQGVLESIVDARGNVIVLRYDTQALLTEAIDSLGRSVEYDYYPEGRLRVVRDHTGREVGFTYDPEGNLQSVTTPTVTGTPQGNDFPSGKRTTYTYSSGFGDESLNHDLLTVTAPNEQPGGPAFYTFTYNTGGGDPLDVGRVETWVAGGTNGSGVAAGGTNTFSYAYPNPGGNPADLTLPRRTTTVSDRAGNAGEYVHNVNGHCVTVTDFTNRGVRPGEGDYVSSYTYNADGEQVVAVFPEGNRIEYAYDSPGADRFREGNLLEMRRIADTSASGGRGDGRGGELEDLVWTYTYEPVFNTASSLTEPRGNDATYVPQNGGAQSAARYTTTWTYDYQEGDRALNGIADLATRWGIDLTGLTDLLGDLNGDSLTDQAVGNRVRRTDPPVLLDPASFQAGIEGDTSQDVVSLFRYNGFGQMIGQTDPEGNEDTLIYHPENDPDGDGNTTPAPADGRVLDTSDGGYQAAHLFDVASDPIRNNGTDPAPANIRHDWLYDSVGNVVRLVDGRGIATAFVWNELNQEVERRTAAATSDAAGSIADTPTGRGETGLTPFAYITRTSYDANDNVVRIDIEDRGGDRDVGGFAESVYEYDILDQVIRETREVSTTEDIVTEFRYDANENMVRTVAPEGNETTTEYDERDLLYSTTRGASGPRGGTPAVTFHFVDGNENVVRIDDALGNPTDYIFDGYDRLVTEIDQVGNTKDYQYDPAGNKVREEFRGPVGGPTPATRSGATNVDLHIIDFGYDELNRLFGQAQELFLPVGATTVNPPILFEGPAAPGDGFINTIYEYDRASRKTFSVEDSGAVYRFEYDGVDRPIVKVLPDDSPTILTYDANNNLIETEEVELASKPGPPDEVFFTTYFFDALDRQVRAVDNQGLTHEREYDSLSGLRAASDANGPAGGTINRRSPGNTGIVVPVNAPGNVTHYTYDGLDRLTVTSTLLTPSGLGDGTFSPALDLTNPANPDGELTVIVDWDGNSLRLSETDDKGDVTTYTYDNLDRKVLTTHDDGTTRAYVYDAVDNVIEETDPNGTVVTQVFDDAWRLTDRTNVPATGVVGTSSQTYEYDGLSRPTFGFDDNTTDSDDDVTITRVYDSLSRMIEETQSISDGSADQTTSYGYQAEDQKVEMIYPGGRQVSYFFDPAGRVETVVDSSGSESADYEYFGMSRVHTRIYANGVRSTQLDDPGTADIGYDGSRRTVVYRHLEAGGGLLSGFDATHDRNGNRTSVIRLHDPAGPDNEGQLHTFDSANRLTGYLEGPLDFGRNPTGPPVDDQQFVYDGNDNVVQIDRNGQSFGSSPSNMNEYDEVQAGGGRVDDGVADDFLDDLATGAADGRNLTHDRNGNLTHNGEKFFEYDFRDRLVNILDAGMSIQTVNTYDAFDRRVERENPGGGGPEPYIRILWADPDPLNAAAYEIEEQDDQGNTIREVVFGLDPDERLWQVNMFGDPQYFLEDDINNVVALIDAQNPQNILERYTYDAFGKPQIENQNNQPVFDGGGNYLPFSSFQNVNLFQGWRYEPESGNRTSSLNSDWGGMYYLDSALFLDPNLGRMITRTANFNPYAFAMNNPVSLGLWLIADPVMETGLDVAESLGEKALETASGLENMGIDGETISAGNDATSAFGWGLTVFEHATQAGGKVLFETAKQSARADLVRQGLTAGQALQKGAQAGQTTTKLIQGANTAQRMSNVASNAGTAMWVAGATAEIVDTGQKLQKEVDNLDRELEKSAAISDKFSKRNYENYKEGRIDKETYKANQKRINDANRERNEAKAQSARANAIYNTVEGGLKALEKATPVPVVKTVKSICRWLGWM